MIRGKNTERDIEVGRLNGSTEITPLIEKPKSTSMIPKVLSISGINLLISLNLVANSKFFVALGPRESAAGSLTTTYQAVVLGGCAGVLLGTGFAIAPALGNKDSRLVGEIARSSMLFALIFSGVTIIAYVVTPGLFPEFLDSDTAKTASEYFLSSAAGMLPTMLMVPIGSFAFQMGDWKFPLVLNAGYRILSSVLSYVLSKVMDSPYGVGIGSSVAPWLGGVAAILWIRYNKTYQAYELTKPAFGELHSNIKLLWQKGWKISLARLAEWGNMTIMASIVGANSNNALKALNPSLQILTLFNLISQGIGLGCGMVIANNRATIEKYYNDRSLFNPNQMSDAKAEVERLHKENISIFKKSICVGVITNIAFGSAIALARTPISRYFLSSDASEDLVYASEKLLLISAISFVCDAIRMITGGALNGYNKMLFQSMNALISMNLVAIGVGVLLGEEFDDIALYLMIARTGMMLLSSLLNGRELYKSIKQDASRCMTLFRSNDSLQQDESSQRNDNLYEESRITIALIQG